MLSEPIVVILNSLRKTKLELILVYTYRGIIGVLSSRVLSWSYSPIGIGAEGQKMLLSQCT